MDFDFNTAGSQKSFELIPDRTICVLDLHIRPGRVGDGGLAKLSKNGDSHGLDIELTVVGGEFDKRKLWDLMTIDGVTDGHKEAADISRRRIRAIVESARGIKPDDNSEAARQARVIQGFGDLEGMRFIGLVGVEPPQGIYAAKNRLREVITPERKEWHRIDQVPTNEPPPPSPAAPSQRAVQPIDRPDWAK
jgi:hypothetical protein